jgi:hypothetical protein
VEFEPPIRRVENFPIDTVPRGQTGSCAVSLHVACVTLRHEMQDTAYTAGFRRRNKIARSASQNEGHGSASTSFSASTPFIAAIGKDPSAKTHRQRSGRRQTAA